MFVLNPSGPPLEEESEESSAATTPEGPVSIEQIAGTRITVLDDKFPDPTYLGLIQEMLDREGAKTARFYKPLVTSPSPTALLEEVAAQSDAVVVGVGG